MLPHNFLGTLATDFDSSTSFGKNQSHLKINFVDFREKFFLQRPRRFFRRQNVWETEITGHSIVAFVFFRTFRAVAIRQYDVVRRAAFLLPFRKIWVRRRGL